MKSIVWIILCNLLLYVVGSFIVWDVNPLNWWLLSTVVGRIFFVIFEVAVIGQSFKE